MPIIDTSLNDVFKSTPMGDLHSAIGTTFYGINHRQTPNPVPINQDGYGLLFFTRPQLNMSSANIRADRTFIPWLSTLDASIQRIIRCYLDPRLMLPTGGNLQAPFVDNENAFIPLFTNHAITATGWPDLVQDTFTSKPGAYKEVFGFTDSSLKIYSAYDIVATFRNMVGDPISSMIHAWLQYKSNVFQGIFVPYPDFIVKNEIDYNTAIYRIVLDKTKRIVQKIAKTRAEPMTLNIGAAFNYDIEKPLNESAERIEVQFRCYGADYNDPMIIHEFNKTVGIFNPAMRVEGNNSLPSANTMVPVKMAELEFFNGRGHPFINPDTMELLWFVRQSEYNAVMQSYRRHNQALNVQFNAGTDSRVSKTVIQK